jgi:hypothetical protein
MPHHLLLTSDAPYQFLHYDYVSRPLPAADCELTSVFRLLPSGVSCYQGFLVFSQTPIIQELHR